MKPLVFAVLLACSHDVPAPELPSPPAADAVIATPPVVVDAPMPDAPPVDAVVVAPVAADAVWLKGSTHVHARPSGDSSEPIPNVVAWYTKHGYDFIVLTDHNQVSELDKTTHTTGVAVANPPTGLIVLAGIELTHNPSGCLPPGDKSKKCRIHVNGIGVTGRPTGKLDWANRKTHARIDKYQSALVAAKAIGASIVQLNHPQWFWGMSGELVAELAHRGVALVEIANVQFGKWNKGDPDHPSMAAIWDDALGRGATIWGVASDDAHDYRGAKSDKYPAGGGWVVVHARRDPQAIVDALAAGRFYSSTGVELAHAEVAGKELVVEVAASDRGTYAIDFIENGKPAAHVTGRRARRALPAAGYVRAVVTRDDGKQAWVQPARP